MTQMTSDTLRKAAKLLELYETLDVRKSQFEVRILKPVPGFRGIGSAAQLETVDVLKPSDGTRYYKMVNGRRKDIREELADLGFVVDE